MTKSKLKEGMRVKLRNGSVLVIRINDDELVMTDGKLFNFWLCIYTDYLTHKYMEEYDIIEVYEPLEGNQSLINQFCVFNYTTIWTREQEEKDVLY